MRAEWALDRGVRRSVSMAMAVRGCSGGATGDNCSNVKIKIVEMCAGRRECIHCMDKSTPCAQVLMNCEYAITAGMTVELKGSVALGADQIFNGMQFFFYFCSPCTEHPHMRRKKGRFDFDRMELNVRRNCVKFAISICVVWI